MNITQKIAPSPVRQEVTVKLTPEAAFRLFTAQFDSWWPRERSANFKTKLVKAVLEPWAGGRWYEVGADGSTCDWGKVLAFEPPRRLLLNWQLGSNFKYDEKLVTEVELLFEPNGDGTVVKLEHRNIERFGDDWERMRAAISSPGGWPGILQAFTNNANL